MVMHDLIRTAQAYLMEADPPDLPLELIQLYEELDKRHPNTVVIAGLISHNPALLADFLKLANRCCAPKEPIKDARAAVNMMGLTEINTLFTCVNISQHLAEDYFEKAVLSDAVKAGLAAAELSYWVYDVSRAEAYMAGLLQNVGVPFLYRRNKEVYSRIFEHQVSQPFSGYQQEIKTYRTSHAHVGMVLAKKWQVNNDIMKAILLHHEADFISMTANHPKIRELTALIQLANFIVVEAQDQEYLHSELKQSRDTARQALELPDAALKAARGAVQKWGDAGLVLGSH
jgi:HD-like signal output (HDOD) protein